MLRMADEINRALKVAAKFQNPTVALDPDNPADTTITLVGAQLGQLTTVFDAQVALVKSDGASL